MKLNFLLASEDNIKVSDFATTLDICQKEITNVLRTTHVQMIHFSKNPQKLSYDKEEISEKLVPIGFAVNEILDII